jgi:molecular chaperone DnaJ
MSAAALGTKVSIETLDGASEVEIKSGFQSADTVILRGLGISRLRGGGRGDLIVHIEVVTPQKLSKEEQELLRSFAEIRGEKRDHVTIHQRGKSDHEHGFFSRFRDSFTR